MDMNTQALNQLQDREDRAERDYKTFGARVVEDMVDELMSNQPITTIRGVKVDLAWILDGEGFISDYEAAVLIAGGTETRWDMLTGFENRARAMVERWITDSPIAAEIISERVRDLVTEADDA